MNVAARILLPGSTGDEARTPVLAFVGDEATRATLAGIGRQAGWPARAVREGGIATALNELAVMPTPRLLVLDVSGSADPVAAIGELADLCEPGTRVLAIGEANDARLFRDLQRAGVDDYLVKPVEEGTLREAIDDALAARETEAAGGEKTAGCRTVVVVGVRGGAGASLIAVNAAWMAAERLGRRTALLDLDFNFGTASLMLDREPGPGLRDALLSPGRIDELFLERAATLAGKNLSLFGAEMALEDGFDPAAAGIEPLVARLEDGFEGVVADMPRDLLAMRPNLIAEAAAVVLVTDLSLAGMRDSMRLAMLVGSVAPKARRVLVGNRVGEFPRAEVPPATFEKSTDLRFDALVPYDAKLAARAAQHGRALVDLQPRGRFARAVEAIGRVVAHEKKVSPPKKGWFRRNRR